MAFLTASTAMASVVRPELRLYSVSPTPTMQYRSFRFPMTGEYTPGPRVSAADPGRLDAAAVPG